MATQSSAASLSFSSTIIGGEAVSGDFLCRLSRRREERETRSIEKKSILSGGEVLVGSTSGRRGRTRKWYFAGIITWQSRTVSDNQTNDMLPLELTLRVQVEYRHGVLIVYKLHIRRQVSVRIDGLGVSEEIVRHLVEMQFCDQVAAMSRAVPNRFDDNVRSRW